MAVNGGTLSADDVLTVPLGTQLTVGPNGTLTGTGTIQGDVASQGTISPGGVGQIGTLTVDGDLAMLAGSNLVVDASNNPSSADKLVVTGDAEYGGTVTVAPLDQLPAGLVLPFLDVSGMVTGNFDRIVSSDPDVAVSLDMANPNRPEIRIETQFGPTATQQNLSNTGTYLDAIGTELSNNPNGLDLQNKLMAATGEDKQRILAQVSPDIYDQNTSALFERNRHFQSAMLSHVARCDVQRRFSEEFVEACNNRRRLSASKRNVWSSVSGFNMDRTGENQYLDYQVNGGAAQFGMDAQVFPGFIVGGSVAAGRTTFENDIRGSGTTSDYDVGLYGQLNLLHRRDLTVDLGVATSLGFGNNKAERNMDAVSQQYKAEFDTTRQSMGVVLGVGSEHKAFSFGGKLTSNLSAVQRGEIVESGNGDLNFIIADAAYAQLDMGVKGDVGYRLRMNDDFYFTPKASLGVTQLVVGDRRELEAKMELAKNNPAVLTVESYDLPTTFNSDLTLELQSKAGMLAYVQAGGDFTNSSISRRLEGGVRLEF